MNELTRAEEQVMQVIWTLKSPVLGRIVEAYPGKAAYTTIQTIVKILVEKGFLKYQTFGKTNIYEPIVSKEEYSAALASSVAERYFNSSPAMMLSAFAKSGSLTAEQYDELRELAKTLLDTQK